MKIKITIENFTISTKLSKPIQVKDLLRQIKSSKILNSNGDEFKLLDSESKILDENEYIIFPENFLNKDIESTKSPQNCFLRNSNNNNNNIKNNNFTNNNLNIKSIQNFEKPEAETRFYLIKYQKLKSKKYSDAHESKATNNTTTTTKIKSQHKKVEIEDLIMKTTNAKTKIDTSKFKHSERSSEQRLNLIDELINSNIGNIMGDNSNELLRGNANQGPQSFSQLLNILRPIIGDDISEGQVIINRSRQGPGSIIINRPTLMRAPLAPDDNMVNSLKEMGFPEEQCRRALRMGRNNISRATDLLLSGEMDYLPSEK